MLWSGRVLAVSYPVKPAFPYSFPNWSANFCDVKPKLHPRWRLMAAYPEPSSSSSSSSSFAASIESDPTDKNASGFCIIEGPETVEDFVKMELQEIQDNIRSRRNKIFLHMEEVSQDQTRILFISSPQLYGATLFEL
ncbi:hypothetical protein F2P56_017907 [Juglans regia]|uniref:Uncharacterized protein n=1 Tax=Juglans regia TaxID=51240 RepID=A0A833X619_JUGRE|nr:hypothetical protein F2P56_017907 [Juglans regia]